MTTIKLKPRSTQDFFENFSSLPAKIQGQPSYQDLNVLRTALYKLAAQVSSDLGGGRCGHVGLIMDPATYTTLSNIQWVDPILPVLEPFAAAMTGPQMAGATQRYNTELLQFQEIRHLDQALLRVVTNTIEPIFMGPLEQPFVGLLNSTTRSVLTWLIKNYGRILPAQAIANRQKLNDSWNASEPFQLLNDRFQKAKEFAQDYGVPIQDAELLTYGVYHIQNTGVLTLPLQKWQDKAYPDRSTWAQFVAHFQPEVLEYQLTKPNQNHYAAMATATMEASLTPFLQCVEIQQQENIQSFANLAESTSALLQQMTVLKQQLADLTNRSPAATAPNAAPKPIRPKTSNIDSGSYCWTHGYYTSAHCTTVATVRIRRPGTSKRQLAPARWAAAHAESQQPDKSGRATKPCHLYLTLIHLCIPQITAQLCSPSSPNRHPSRHNSPMRTLGPQTISSPKLPSS